MEKIKMNIRGRVQGVGFRYYVLELAKQTEITGYTKNLADGSVEVVAEGDPVDIENFMENVKKGPPNSNVQEVAVELGKSIGEFENFEIRK